MSVDPNKDNSAEKPPTNPQQQVYPVDNMKVLADQLMREFANDSKYRDFVMMTAYSDQRPPVDDADDLKQENMYDKPRFNPDNITMSI